MICNPAYAGFGPFPALVSDEQWAAAATAIEEEGAEQFLVSLLYVLRQIFNEDKTKKTAIGSATPGPTPK